MAIVKDKKNNRYYINYKIKTLDGKWKNINIRNKNWAITGENKVSLRDMKLIEAKEIEKDKAKRVQGNSQKISNIGDLLDLFYKVLKSENIDDETIYNYQLCYKKYLFDVIPINTKIDNAFTIHQIDLFRISICSQGLKENTINNKFVALKNLIKFAKTRKIISRDVADDAIDLLQPIKPKNKNDSKENYLKYGENDIKKFIQTFDEHDQEWKVPVLTLFYGALRVGEWQAITKKSCDFENCLIKINKQLDAHGNLKTYTKNRTVRYVRIPRPFMQKLEKYVNDQDIGDDDFIFSSKNFSHISRRKIRELVNSHLKLANLDHITLHGLRHTFATRMFDKGYDVKEVQQHLGHSSMATTMKYYIHYTESKKKKDIDDLL